MSMPDIFHDGKPRYRVVTFSAAVEVVSGTVITIYKGAPLPLDARPAHIKHLLANGLIAKIGASE